MVDVVEIISLPVPTSRTNGEIIKQLKNMGFDVHVTHKRRHISAGGLFTHKSLPHWSHVFPRGGKTEVMLLCPEGETLWHRKRLPNGKYEPPHKTDFLRGEANCTMRDNYNKGLGLSIALGRLLKELRWSLQQPD